VEAVAAELNYRVDQYASRLASGRNDTVGLAVPTIGGWYFSQVAAGVEAVMAERGLDVLLYSIEDERGRQRLLSQLAPTRRRLDGIVLIDVLLTDDEVEWLDDETLTVVTVGQRTGPFPSVTIDNVGAARAATRHLIDLGHRDIALIGGPIQSGLTFSVPEQRRHGFCEELAEAGIAMRSRWEFDGGWSVTGGAEAMGALLDGIDPPSAVFVASDEMAMGAMRAADDRGVRVPEDLSIIGFDDHDLAELFGLSTVVQDPAGQGAAAARLLLDSLDDDGTASSHQPFHVVSPTPLAPRRTTGPAAR